MSVETINGVGIWVEEYGAGDTLVLVHGSWVDHMDWPFLVPLLAQRFRVVVYDRRGHSRSERLPGQGSVREDVADLAAIIARAGAPAHVVGNSMGGTISLRLATERPELIRTLAVHEPPLFQLLREDPRTRPMADAWTTGAQGAPGELLRPVIAAIEAGRHADGARLFVDRVIGAGAWEDFVPDVAKEVFIANASTFLDEVRDPEVLTIDLAPLRRFDKPVLLTDGSDSPAFFAPVVDRLAAVLPHATRKTFAGAGHVPHITHPQHYAAALMAFVEHG